MDDSATPLVRIEQLVRFLCSPPCAGRRPGTPEGIAARTRIVAEFEDAGLEPVGDDGFVQPVPRCGANVLGMLPGRSDRAVLIAAHYDHLGHGDGDDVYWGADDNAAAVAIMVEVARDLARDRHRLGRSVIFAAFDGEEPPHFLDETMGSMHYVAHPPRPLHQLDLMVCMDLCGHALGPSGFPEPVRNSLFVMGAELSEGTTALVTNVARDPQVTPRLLDLDVIPPLSDYYAFRKAGVPVLFLTCGRWEHYHTPTDTPDKLDYPKVAGTARWLRELVVAASNRPEARVVFDDRARDDVTTLRTMLEMGQLLAPHLPAVATFAPIGEELLRKAEAGPLGAADRQMITQLLMGLESLLEGSG